MSAALLPTRLDGELSQLLLMVLVMVQGHLEEFENRNRLYCEAVVLFVIIPPHQNGICYILGISPLS